MKNIFPSGTQKYIAKNKVWQGQWKYWQGKYISERLAWPGQQKEIIIVQPSDIPQVILAGISDTDDLWDSVWLAGNEYLGCWY